SLRGGWFWRRRRLLVFLFLTVVPFFLSVVVLRFLADFRPARPARSQLPVLIHNHHRVGTCANVGVDTFLHARTSSQLNIASRRDVSGLVGAADRARWRSAIRIGTIAHDRDVSVGNRFFQSLVFTFRNVNGQFLGLQGKARIGDLHVAAENAHALIRIKERVVGRDFSRNRTTRLRAFHSAEQRVRVVGRRLFLRLCLFFFLCRGSRWRVW